MDSKAGWGGLSGALHEELMGRGGGGTVLRGGQRDRLSYLWGHMGVPGGLPEITGMGRVFGAKG